MAKQIKDSKGKVVAELLQEEDIKSNLNGKTIAVIGYASQGRGQSLCYRDSGVSTIIGLRKGGESWKLALEDGWKEGKTLTSKQWLAILIIGIGASAVASILFTMSFKNERLL